MEILIALAITIVAPLLICLIYIEIQTGLDKRQALEWDAYKKERRIELSPKLVVTHTNPPPLSYTKDKFIKDMWKRYNDTHQTKSRE